MSHGTTQMSHGVTNSFIGAFPYRGTLKNEIKIGIFSYDYNYDVAKLSHFFHFQLSPEMKVL